MMIIDTLYHYTCVESLALILKNHTIRFNSLENMDDIQEGQTKDLNHAAKFVFVSSWTDESVESIPMWNMYASFNNGVRIRMKANPFRTYYSTRSDVQKLVDGKLFIDSEDERITTFVDVAKMLEQGFYSQELINGNLLRKVKYTSDKKMLYPEISETTSNSKIIHFERLGIHKNLSWEFQNEWRYMMRAIPFDLSLPYPNLLKRSNEMCEGILAGTEQPPFNYYDISIDDACFSSMEITLSPKISPGNRLIVQDLVAKYNPSAVVKESSLLGTIR